MSQATTPDQHSFGSWMAVCEGRGEFLHGTQSLPVILSVTALFHMIQVATAVLIPRVLGIEKGRRECVFFMEAKDLPLSLIILAVLASVLHHIIHLALDTGLVRYL